MRTQLAILSIAAAMLVLAPWPRVTGQEEQAAASRQKELIARLTILERHVFSRADWDDSAWKEDSLALKKLAGILVVTSAPGGVAVDSNGAIDVFLPVRRNLMRGEDLIPLCGSRRFDTGPTLRQMRMGDVSFLPYARFSGPAPSGKAPILWDRWPTKRGRLVAFADANVKLLKEAQFQDIMKQYGQSSR